MSSCPAGARSRRPGRSRRSSGSTSASSPIGKAAEVPGFRPSLHGLHFANRFPPGPTLTLGPVDPRWVGIGDAADGLCGGLSLTVRDLWEAGLPPPSQSEPPTSESRRFRALVRRQVESLDWGRVPLRFWLLAMSPRRLRTTLGREWPRLRAVLDAGRLVPLGLVRAASANPFRLTHNHQVLAYGYEETAEAALIRIYDPNWPDRDDVAIVVHHSYVPRGATLRQTTGEPLSAFFVAPYAPRPVHAWR